MTTSRQRFPCGLVPRRTFLADLGMGFAGLALGAMLHRDGYGQDLSAWTPPDGLPHFAPKVKSVIWFFMIGGVSHVESFDPKPALNRYAGMSISETPYAKGLQKTYADEGVSALPVVPGQLATKVFPLQVSFRKRGECGTEVSDWWPHVGNCVDDIAVIRSMWINDNNHGAQLQLHTGRRAIDGYFPTIGSWIHYGLGSLNENLPQFVVLGKPLADCCGGQEGHRANYLGAEHDGVPMVPDPANPLAFGQPANGVYRQEQQAEFELVDRLNRMVAAEYPDDDKIRARIKSYELAFRMQRTVPDVFDFSQESTATQQLYGLNKEVTAPFAKNCLGARRLVERGVRFVQIYHGHNGSAGGWDAHSELKKHHATCAEETDQPIAALLIDLKQRGMLDETLVVWATEFGRTPYSQGNLGDTGRDHHPHGFSVWMAGGGVKGGVVHGATDELGFNAIENRHYVTDIHATVLHQLGLDSRRLEITGRKRLQFEHGHVIGDILA